MKSAPVCQVHTSHFKGAWEEPFEPAETKDELFTTANGRTIQTPTMHREGEFSYYETDTFQSVALPYKDPRFELVLVLLKKPDAAPATGWTSALASANYADRDGFVALPRLDITWESNLTASLRSIGLETALGSDANFSGLADGPLAVGEVIHETRLIVDEKGAVGAAATAVPMPLALALTPSSPFRFIAHRPFWLLLREKTTGAPIFLGYVAAPHG